MDQRLWSWDNAKNARNREKHGLSFETASLVFSDHLAQTVADPCDTEERWRTLGEVRGILILVVHTDPIINNGRLITSGRIISARKATAHERQWFEENRYE